MSAVIAEQADLVIQSHLAEGYRVEPPLVVGVDGLAVLAASDLVSSGRLRLAPGGPRWLADFWSASAVDPDQHDGLTLPEPNQAG